MMTQDIKVVELFAGVGGFRIGLEGASDSFKTVWSNQWEPSTKKQDASIIYQARFGSYGHSNVDINLVNASDIPNHDLLVGGFPCQDYSVAATLNRSGGIEGKKGVLWWEIVRIIDAKRPSLLFFENVDRLLKSPASQRGRDFAIMLASLADLGYIVEWRVINAADYGMPQRRRRTYILGYRQETKIYENINNPKEWVLSEGVLAKAFPISNLYDKEAMFNINGSLQEVSDCFNKKKRESPFQNSGIMIRRKVYSANTFPNYLGEHITLGDIIVPDNIVPSEFFISNEDLPKWEYQKDAKKIKRKSKQGFEYVFSEGSMAFPDYLDRPSRTIITGEGGAAPSRFKHVILSSSGRFRRLVPIELERLNMFPDNHTQHPLVNNQKRAFLMGNALVCGVIERIGRSLYQFLFDELPVSSKPINMQRNGQPNIILNLFAQAQSSVI